MSLICKLDPTVRKARYARRELLRFLGDECSRIRRFPASEARLKLESWLVTATIYVETLLKCSWRSGEKKNELCARVGAEYRAMILALPRPPGYQP